LRGLEWLVRVPIVTLSRLPGSLGDEVAQGLAERLGFRLVTRPELIRLADEQLGGPGAWERSPELGERAPSFWERVTGERQHYRYCAVLRSVVFQRAEQDDVVIAGLGAGRVLRGLPQVLAVLVTAPPDVRLERIVERGFEGVAGPLPRDRARDLLRRREHDSATYMRYMFGINWLEAHHWDLVLDTSRFAVPQSVEVLSAIVERGLLQATPADRQRLADLGLASRVEQTLLGRPGVLPDRLKVVADSGRVRLEGEVGDEADRAAAEQAARAVPGVRELQSELLVHAPPTPIGG
jgi:cytidylate kinase